VGVLGEFVDLECILTFKNFLNRLGIADFCSLRDPHHLNLDFRSSCMPRLSPLREKEVALLIGTNPRLEASLFNTSLRRALNICPAKPAIATVGWPMDLTYRKNHCGSGTKTLFEIYGGRDVQRTPRTIILARGAKFYLGSTIFRRGDGDSLTPILNTILRYSCSCRSAGLRPADRRSAGPRRVGAVGVAPGPKRSYGQTKRSEL
jgi:hypothetical protein